MGVQPVAHPATASALRRGLSRSATTTRRAALSRAEPHCVYSPSPQSASRSFLARVIPAGREGEVFGLYATTGRAATFLAPTAFAIFVTIGHHQVWGIIGIVLVLAIGLALMIPVKSKQKMLEDPASAR